MTERFFRFVHTHQEFRPFVEKGLAEAILSVEGKIQRDIFQMPQTVSWERVYNKLPGIYLDLIEAVESEKRRLL